MFLCNYTVFIIVISQEDEISSFHGNINLLLPYTLPEIRNDSTGNVSFVRSEDTPQVNMDLNEFHLMFKKESPIFNSVVLEDIVKKTLLEENVQHSVRSPTSGRHVSDFESGKQLVTTVAKDKNSSVDSSFQSSSISKKQANLQKCSKRRTLVTKRRTNYEAVDTTSLNPTAISQSSNSSQYSSQIAAHAPQSFPARAQEVLSSQHLQQSHEHRWESKASVSKSNGFSDNESLSNCKQLKSDKGSHNVLKSACDNSGSRQHNGIWIKNDERMREKNCQSFPSNALQSFFLSKNVSVESSRILNEILCSCQETCSKDAKEVMSPTCSRAASKTTFNIPENNSKGTCLKLVPSEKQGKSKKFSYNYRSLDVGLRLCICTFACISTAPVCTDIQ